MISTMSVAQAVIAFSHLIGDGMLFAMNVRFALVVLQPRLISQRGKRPDFA